MDITTSHSSISPYNFTSYTDHQKAKESQSETGLENDQKNSSQATDNTEQNLSESELKELTELKQRDQEVKAHEQAHIQAGGQYVKGGAKFEYQKGPDGRNYAVGGEVSIDISEISGDPEATAQKMQTIRKAALAPVNPSSTDRKVAAKASRIETQARMEALSESMSKNNNESGVNTIETKIKQNASLEKYSQAQNFNIQSGLQLNISA